MQRSLTYDLEINPNLYKKFKKLEKKNKFLLEKAKKKIKRIQQSPRHNHKFLKHSMKGFNRIHLDPHVLVFKIDHEERKIILYDLDHHNNVYKK